MRAKRNLPLLTSTEARAATSIMPPPKRAATVARKRPTSFHASSKAWEAAELCNSLHVNRSLAINQILENATDADLCTHHISASTCSLVLQSLQSSDQHQLSFLLTSVLLQAWRTETRTSLCISSSQTQRSNDWPACAHSTRECKESTG